MQQRLRVDGDIFENAPRVDAAIFYTDKKRCVYINIRIRVDGALVFRTHCESVSQSDFRLYVKVDGKKISREAPLQNVHKKLLPE